MKRALIVHLHAIAKQRKPGYVEACQRAGQPSPDGRWLIFTEEAHRDLRQSFSFSPREKVAAGRMRGLGDLIHKVAGPIGRAVRWPCMKGNGTTELKPGSPCDRARRALNAVPIR